MDDQSPRLKEVESIENLSSWAEQPQRSLSHVAPSDPDRGNLRNT